MSKTDAQSIVLDFLIKQNRPYNVNLLQSTLKSLSKAPLQKALDALVDSGRVTCKDKIFWATQEEDSGQDVEKLEEEKKSLEKEIKTLHEDVSQLESQHRSLNSTSTLEQIERRIENLGKECDTMEAKLSSLRNSKVIITKEDREKIEKAHAIAQQNWRKRKKMAMEIIGSLQEGVGLTLTQLKEDAGIETDEDHKVSLATNEANAKRLKF